MGINDYYGKDIGEFDLEWQERLKIIKLFLLEYGLPKDLFKEGRDPLTYTFVYTLVRGADYIRRLARARGMVLEDYILTPEFRTGLEIIRRALRGDRNARRAIGLGEKTDLPFVGYERDKCPDLVNIKYSDLIRIPHAYQEYATALAIAIKDWRGANQSAIDRERDRIRVAREKEIIEKILKGESPEEEVILDRRYITTARRDELQKIEDGYEAAVYESLKRRDEIRKRARHLVEEIRIVFDPRISFEEINRIKEHELRLNLERLRRGEISYEEYERRGRELEAFYGKRVIDLRTKYLRELLREKKLPKGVKSTFLRSELWKAERERYKKWGEEIEKIRELERMIDELDGLESRRNQLLPEKYEKERRRILKRLYRVYEGLTDENLKQIIGEFLKGSEKNVKEIKNTLQSEVERLKETRGLYKFPGKESKSRILGRFHWLGGTEFAQKIHEKYGPIVTKGIMMAAMVGIGAVIAGTFGSTWFFFGFLAWGLYYLTPDPEEFEIPHDLENMLRKNPLSWGILFSSRYLRNERTGWGFLRSFFKLSAYFCFIWALWNNLNIPFVTPVLIAVSFMGYYSFAIEYDTKKPYEVFESLIRFGGLGMLFIPWFIFYGLFDSIVIALIAMAFFAIPPIPHNREDSELFRMYEIYDKMIFVILMIIVLFGFIFGWDVPKVMRYTFIYFLIITGISGFFSPPEARPGIGFIMLGAATIIYGIGPGQQEVMSALLGPYWPSIHNALESIGKPLADAFGGLSNTFHNAFVLLTNPVGYATQLMNASYAENPIGKTGAFGVDIEGIEISQIFVEQPYTVSVTLKNNGAADAKNVIVFLSPGFHAPKKEEGRPFGAAEWARRVTPKELGINMSACESDGYITSRIKLLGMEEGGEKICARSRRKNGKDHPLTRQDIWRVTFMSNGISCGVVNDYNLRKKYIPFNITVVYDYESDAKVEVEFISDREWRRLVDTGEINRKLRFIRSECSSAPVKLSVGTPGIKNPLRADQEFYIGVNLVEDDRNGWIPKVKRIALEFPEVFGTPQCTEIAGKSPEITSGKVVWNNLPSGSKVLYCKFNALGEKNLGAPTKTFIVTAHAEYTFVHMETKSGKLEFGGRCCEDKDCLEGQKCKDGVCVYGEVEISTPGNFVFGSPDYCEEKIKHGYGKCDFGEGGCKSDEECDSTVLGPQNNPLKCKDVGISVKVCCFDNPDQCKASFENIKRKQK